MTVENRHACMHAYIDTCICIHMHAYNYRYIHIYIHTYIHTDIGIYIHTHTHINKHTHMHAYIHGNGRDGGDVVDGISGLGHKPEDLFIDTYFIYRCLFYLYMAAGGLEGGVSSWG
jgi:hypothetical protein